MAEVNVDKQRSQDREQEGSQSLQGREQQGMARRSDFPSLWRDPSEFFNMNPFTLMRRFSEEMNRSFSGAGFGSSGMWSPAIEVSEREGQIVVNAELPGLSKDDVKIEVTDEALSIHGERRREYEDRREGFHRSERSYGSFYRTIPLPPGAKTDEARAQFENGVLQISVPVAQEQPKRRQIPVEAGSAERKQPASENAAPGGETKAG